jgi:hypothetical protein
LHSADQNKPGEHTNPEDCWNAQAHFAASIHSLTCPANEQGKF